MSRLDSQEERDLQAYLSAMHDPDDEQALRDAETAAELDAILRRASGEHDADAEIDRLLGLQP